MIKGRWLVHEVSNSTDACDVVIRDFVSLENCFVKNYFSLCVFFGFLLFGLKRWFLIAKVVHDWFTK